MSKVVCHLLTKPIIVLSNSAKKYSPQPWLHQAKKVKTRKEKLFP